MRVIDFADDQGALLAAALGGSEPAELLKTASFLRPEDALDRDFALILIDNDGTEHRKFACSDPGNTLVSLFYLEQRGHEELNPAAIKVAAANLTELGQQWGLTVPDEVSKLASLPLMPLEVKNIIDERRVVFTPPAKQAAAPPPVQGFDRAAEIIREWDEMAPVEKRAAALELGDLSQDIPIQVPLKVFRYGGAGLSEKFASAMKDRLYFVRDGKLAAEYTRLAKVASHLGADQTLSVLYELDNRAGLRWMGGDRYGNNLPDPVRCVFSQEKTAEWSWIHGGETVSEGQLARFRISLGARKLFTDMFADRVWERFDRDPLSTFKGLPLEQQILVSRLARQHA